MKIRYDMPAMFGPSLLPDTSSVTGVTVASISFETVKDDAASLLPPFFEVAAKPIVTLTYIDYPSLEYLGGRGYRELVVAVSSVFKHDGGEIRAGFAPVMWVDQAGALISGREFMGFGKLLGSFKATRVGDELVFQCKEYDAVLLKGEVSGLCEIDTKNLESINRGAAEVNTFGWKYISGEGGEPDADYPLVNVTRWNYKRAWSGEGKLTFYDVTSVDAPLSSRVIAALSKLPMRAYVRAFVAEGDVVIDRAGTKRLC